MEKCKGCNRFPDFLCVFQTDFVERRITALENITFCVSFNLSFNNKLVGHLDKNKAVP